MALSWYVRYGMRTMTTILPERDEADALVPAPGSPAWRYSSDGRLMAGAGYALMLQVAHPVIGAGVLEHSNFKADPWGRLLRTLDFTTSMVYGGPELAWQTGQRVRAMHTQIKGLLPNGERYHAMEPTAYAWVHATLADAIVRANAYFVRPIPAGELEAFWAQWRAIGRLLGVRDRDLPSTWAEFGPYYEGMVRDHLVRTQSVDDVLDVMAAPPPPAVRGVPRPVWNAVRRPAARGGRLGTIGLMSPALREKLGLEWTRANAIEFRAIGRAARASGPLLPSSVRRFGPSYLRWRSDAIARGEVASGKGSKFVPAAAP